MMQFKVFMNYGAINNSDDECNEVYLHDVCDIIRFMHIFKIG